MDGKKVYSIQINGVQESIDAVLALNKMLNELENRIQALEKKNIKINTGGSSSSKGTSALSEEAKLEKQIEAIDAKREAYSKEIYQNYLAAKDVLNETVKDQKQLAAAERLQADAYSNTMAGIKQKLADLKNIHFTTDISSDEFKKQTQEINALTQKLKELEAEYGQFGRNVGNYKSAFDGFAKYKIDVNGVTREFNSAREAARILKNELLTLPKGAEGAQALRDALHQVNSELRDLEKSSPAMDNLLDTMEGFMAVANAGQGIRALFGVDDAEIQKSIKNLVALQNVLKGIETINKQISTREGVGKWIAPFTTQIDKATVKVLKFNTALLGTGKAAKIASVAIKGFSKVLKGIASIGILLAIDLLIDGMMKLVDTFKKVDDTAERTKEILKAQAEAYGEASAKIVMYTQKVKSFNGTKEQEKKLVEELNREFGDTLGTYSSLAKWYDVLQEKGEKYIELMELQAKVQIANKIFAAALEEQMQFEKKSQSDFEKWYDALLAAVTGYKMAELAAERYAEEQAKVNQKVEEGRSLLIKYTEATAELSKKYSLGINAPQVGKNTKKAAEDTQRTINDLELRLMREGLNKKLRQLDEEERQTINKLKQNGRITAIELQKIQRSYAELRRREIENYLKEIEKSVEDSAKAIRRIKFDLDIEGIGLQVEEVKNAIKDSEKEFEKLANEATRLVSRQEFNNIGVNEVDYQVAGSFLNMKKFAKEKPDEWFGEYYRNLKLYISKQNEEVQKKFDEIYDKTIGNDAQKRQAQADYAFDIFKKEYDDALRAFKVYGDKVKGWQTFNDKGQVEILKDSLRKRLDLSDKYYNEELLRYQWFIREEEKLAKERADKAYQRDAQAEKDRYNTQFEDLEEKARKAEEAVEAEEKSNKKDVEQLKRLKEARDRIYAQIEEALELHLQKLDQLRRKHSQDDKKIEEDAQQEILSSEEKYFDGQISLYRDSLSKMNDLLSKATVTDKGFGIVNIAQTKRNFKEIEEGAKEALEGIKADKDKTDKAFEDGFIDKKTHDVIINQLDDVGNSIQVTLDAAEEESKQVIKSFIESCMQYIQALSESFNTIMSAVWDAQDAAFDKEQEEIDKWNDKLDKALDEQQEIIEQHKDAIDSIEDKLANARGDRRQHLIDQLNEEIAAQRAAQKEEQRIKREQEAAEKKQEELDKKRREAEYHRNLTQAIVNGALSITYAALNKWPVPAIPMMAIAGATTAAQIAIMASNKPYAKGGQLDGGVAQGKRHRDGGIPVLGGRASIEGGEFITNRQTTANNVDLLEFVNSKHRKLNIDDFIDFYSSGKAKKNIISMSPRTKFADGGQIPTLDNTYSFDDRLLESFEKYSNRPVQVSVVDINNKQDDVKRVQALAGLEV